MLRVHAAVGDRLGEERSYRTAFGKRTFAIGDLVVAREPNRDAAKSVNRDAFTVTGHRDDGRLDLERERDGQRVTWNLPEKPRLDFGYARTSNSSQGRTVDDQFVLPARNRRGAYVDVTRARQKVTIAYGQDEIPDFGRLMAQAQRDNGKTLVRDAVTAQAERKAQQKRAEDVKRGYSPESIGHYYQTEDEIVRGKDGAEYTVAEGWHTIVAAVSLDGKDLRQAAVVFEATSDDGTKVHMPKMMGFSELDEGVDAGTVEIYDDFQQRFGLAVVRAEDREAAKRKKRDFAQAYELRDVLKRGGVSERDLPGTEALMAKLPDLRKRAALVERDPWKNVTQTDIMAKLVRDDLGLGRSRGMHR